MTAVQPDNPPPATRLFGVVFVRQKNVLERSWLRACGWRPAADRQAISDVCAVCSQRPFTAQKKGAGGRHCPAAVQEIVIDGLSCLLCSFF